MLRLLPRRDDLACRLGCPHSPRQLLRRHPGALPVHGDFARLRVVACTQRLRDPAVRLRPFAGDHPSPYAFGQERVAQRNAVARGIGQQAPSAQDPQQRDEVVAAGAGHLGHHVGRQRPVRDAQRTSQGPGGVGESLQACVEQVGQERRQRGIVGFVGGELFREQGLSLGPAMDLVEPAVGLHLSQQERQLLGSLRPGQRSEDDGAATQSPYPSEPLRVERGSVVVVQAPRADERHVRG